VGHAVSSSGIGHVVKPGGRQRSTKSSQDGELAISAEDQFVLRDQQVATLATSDIETDGLPERLTGLEIDHVK